jgi:hypothetical protein
LWGLLSAAALLGKSLRNLEHQNFGFATEGRYLVSINPTLGNDKPEQMEPKFREIDDRLRQIPGVRMAAPVLYAPTTRSETRIAVGDAYHLVGVHFSSVIVFRCYRGVSQD